MLCRLARSALSGVFFLVYGLFALPFAPLLMLPVWRAQTVRAIIRNFYRSFVLLADITGLYSVEYDVSSLRKIRGKVVVANHLSLIDICVVMAALPDSTAIAKAAILSNPFLGMVVKKAFLTNDRPVEEVIAEAGKLLSSGVNLIVFPQGTRGGVRLHRGAARIALATRSDIVCLRLSYDPLVLAKGQPWWDVGKRKIRIRIENRGNVHAQGESDHGNAIKTTELIAERIGISGSSVV